MAKRQAKVKTPVKELDSKIYLSNLSVGQIVQFKGDISTCSIKSIMKGVKIVRSTPVTVTNVVTIKSNNRKYRTITVFDSKAELGILDAGVIRLVV